MKAAAIAAGAAVVLAVAGAWTASYASEETRTCTVTGTDRTTVSTGDGHSSDMRVYTRECGTLAVEDVPFRGQWNSADIFGALEEGRTYEVTTIGWRIPWASIFPSILGTPREVTP